MLLTEEHRIRKDADKALFREIDDCCYHAKNLYNSTNCLIRQCRRIQSRLCSGTQLEGWEQEMADRVNEGIRLYNMGKDSSRQKKYVDASNGIISDAYFLSWHLKNTQEYRDMPYATCSQICIQELCRAWKSYYASMKAYLKKPEGFAGCPHTPGYLDPKKGRGWLVITAQNFHIEKDGSVRMPQFLKGIHVRARHSGIRQIRIRTERTFIRILLVYEKEKDVFPAASETSSAMGIDLGVDNLVTAVWDSDLPPVIINGRAVKSTNQFYNKKRAELQSEAKKHNRSDRTARMSRLTEKRNRKIRDQMHKVSRKVISLACRSGVRLIVVGNNKGWKQKVNLGNRTNQNFVSVPYSILTEMIRYKAELAGIEVRVTAESYTSGTSYLDGEMPDVKYYDKSRRISRGMFRSNTGVCINADVNAAYQILRAGGIKDLKIKEKEQVTRIKVS